MQPRNVQCITVLRMEWNVHCRGLLANRDGVSGGISKHIDEMEQTQFEKIIRSMRIKMEVDHFTQMQVKLSSHFIS